jgi:GntR family transcriptional repressor for pyruvate dehydrogenase complex
METNTATPIGTRVPLGTRVADALRDQISQQGLSEGDELPSESQLAQQFGVSGRVIRDALRRLDNQGVVETRQGKRAIVSGLRPIGVQNYFTIALEADALSMEELLELRLMLEVPAARLAAERATRDDIATMKRLLLDLEQTGTALDARVPADIALHDAITEASGNRFVHGILHSLSHALSEERRRGGELRQAEGSDHADSDASHHALVAAIEARDPDAAEFAARAIVTRAQAEFAARR